MQKTSIEYLTHTWNPIKMTCTPVSLGCANCWHLAIGKRFGKHTGEPVLIEGELDAPLRLRKPAIVGVQFMGDLFHEAVPDEYIMKVFETIYNTPLKLDHEYIILTKRPDRALHMFETGNIKEMTHVTGVRFMVSVENQETADKRVPLLLSMPVHEKGVSYEPAIGPVDFTRWLPSKILGGPGEQTLYGLDWLIMGGETGPGARPMKIEWARSIAEQCVAAGVPLFYKQGPDDYGNAFVKMPFLMGREWRETP